MAASKVEIKLRKGDAQNWSKLFIEKQVIIEDKQQNNIEDSDKDLCNEIETVDLSDI